MVVTGKTFEKMPEAPHGTQRAFYFSLWLFVAISFIMVPVFVAKNAETLRRFLGEPQTSGTTSPDDVHATDRDFAVEDNSASRILLQRPLSRSVLISGEDIRQRCKRLTYAGQEQPELQRTQQGGQCSVLLVDEQDALKTTFLQIRTDQIGYVRFFRIKFSEEAASQVEFYRNGIKQLRVFGGLGEDLLAHLDDLVAQPQWGTGHRGMFGLFNLSVSPELSDKRRINLIGTANERPVRGIGVFKTVARSTGNDRLQIDLPQLKKQERRIGSAGSHDQL